MDEDPFLVFAYLNSFRKCLDAQFCCFVVMAVSLRATKLLIIYNMQAIQVFFHIFFHFQITLEVATIIVPVVHMGKKISIWVFSWHQINSASKHFHHILWYPQSYL